MSTRATALGDMSQEQLENTVYDRRCAYQRALSAIKARGDDGMFEAIVHSHLDDVQAMRGVPLEVTMHAAVVTDDSGGYDIRGIYATREIARQRLEMEVAAKTHVPLVWDEFGDFSVSQKVAITGCQYHTDPVVVHA
jgi:hypothetical protein